MSTSVMGNSSYGERKPMKKPAQASSRKGCMRGKGGTSSSNSSSMIRATTNDVTSVYNDVSSSVMSSFPNENMNNSQGNVEVNEEGIEGFWENMSVNLPVLDESIWAEAAMSLDFPVMDIEPGSFGSTLGDTTGWDALQSPWCM
ncbi:putative Dehydration-responsive element-binding protein 2G [Corchorus olitorius]|uniref:Dehydration-responsive element-binding protein 2G n=1 Tax=Corchorus olitorius TaxID=93759 RepID=A0A1R3HY36_9ROSI|nr:putative Dehydration-responsive element-binding protein 2G [Corchorus olitorius]